MPQDRTPDDWRVIHLLAEDAADLPRVARELVHAATFPLEG